MKTIILAILIMGMCSTNAFAQENITVTPDNDTKAICESTLAYVGTFMRTAWPCKQQLANDMKQSGKTDAQIQQLLPPIEKKCMCQNKAQFQEQLQSYDNIIVRHPNWKGKIIVVNLDGIGDPTARGNETCDPTIWEHVRQQLSQCP